MEAMKRVKRVRVASNEAVRWGVYRLRKKAERIGYVQASDPASAIKRSIGTFSIVEGERCRISVQRER